MLEDRELIGDLESLQAIIGQRQFSIFEALNASNNELLHSDFLAFLLRPTETHGLGDHFLRRFLLETLDVAPDVLDPNQLEVCRERYDTDLLIVDDLNNRVIVIENKVGSSEHSGQLQRYHQQVDGIYQDYSRFYLFLTPSKARPSDPSYRAVGYDLIADLVDELLGSTLVRRNSKLRLLLEDYSRVVKRDLLGNMEAFDMSSSTSIPKLCEELYEKHGIAIEQIYRYRPQRWKMIKELLHDLVDRATLKRLDTKKNKSLTFIPLEWDVDKLRSGIGMPNADVSGQVLAFEFQFDGGSLTLRLMVNPGPFSLRQLLRAIALSERKSSDSLLFNATPPNDFPENWITLYKRVFFTRKHYEEMDDSQIRDQICSEWEGFLKELPGLRQSFLTNMRDILSI